MALTPAQQGVAKIIIRTGQRRHAPRHVIRVAVGAAMTEANLGNPHGGDADSQGAFQQRPSMGWGSIAQVTNVAYAANKFYDKAIPLYQRGERGGRLAQSVQVSAFPGRYQPNVKQAGGIVRSVVGSAGAASAAGAAVAKIASTKAKKVAASFTPAARGVIAPTNPTRAPLRLASAPLAGAGGSAGGRAQGDLAVAFQGRVQQGSSTPATTKTTDAGTSTELTGAGATIFSRFNKAAKDLEAMHNPYVWGGGHQPVPQIGRGVDCSGAMRWLLRQSGWKGALPSVSGDFAHFGKPGPGAITFYSSPTHVFAKIGNRFFGTSRSNPAGGAGWIEGGHPTGGYTVTHLPGIGREFAKSLGKQKVQVTNGTMTDRPRFSDKPILSDHGRRRR